MCKSLLDFSVHIHIQHNTIIIFFLFIILTLTCETFGVRLCFQAPSNDNMIIQHTNIIHNTHTHSIHRQSSIHLLVIGISLSSVDAPHFTPNALVVSAYAPISFALQDTHTSSSTIVCLIVLTLPKTLARSIKIYQAISAFVRDE